MSRSILSRLTSRFSRLISLRASVVRPSLRRPSSRSACLTQFRIVCSDGSNSRATDPGLRPALTSSTTRSLYSGGYRPLLLPAMIHLLGWTQWKGVRHSGATPSTSPRTRWTKATRTAMPERLPPRPRWKIKVSMASADSAGVAGVRWEAKRGNDYGYFFSVGGGTDVADSVNWQFGNCWGFSCNTSVNKGDQYGWSDDIEVGVLQEFHIWMEGDLVYVRIGEDGAVAGARREAERMAHIDRAPRTARAGRLQPEGEGPHSRLRLGGAHRQMTYVGETGSPQ